jgi:uncharacterized protein YegL
MKNNKTIYHFVVDQSGSMSGSEVATIEGFNSQLNTLKKLKVDNPNQEYLVSVTFFEDEVMDIIRFAQIEDVQLLNRENYKPGGLTALLDGIGKSIDQIQNNYSHEIRDDKATVVMVILTDGGENASQYYTHKLVAERIKELDASGKWTFSFLAADLNALESTDRLNIRRENVVSFSKANYSHMMDQVSASISAYENKKSSGFYDNNLFDGITDKDQRDINN